jgi:hypothetical protein
MASHSVELEKLINRLETVTNRLEQFSSSGNSKNLDL